MKKRITVCLLALLLVIGMIPSAVSALPPSVDKNKVGDFYIWTTNTNYPLRYDIDYTYIGHELCIKTETPITISGSTTTDRIIIDSNTSANITLEGVNIDLSATGDPSQSLPGDSPLSQDSLGKAFTLTLAEGAVNTLKGGYHAAGLRSEHSNGLLTINGKGQLDVYGGYSAAGIGGNSNEGGGAICILSGTINAYGNATIPDANTDAGGAGIGGGANGAGIGIEIRGGTVTAIGGRGCAGIGGGINKAGRNITISGGTVTATGSWGGAGIGGGKDCFDSDTTNLYISGGTVKATGSDGGAGIGGGLGNIAHTIKISGGTVIATGGDGGAGIGGGQVGKGANITISDGTVTAIGGENAAAIGGGQVGDCVSVTISGGTVRTVAKEGCNPIGGGANSESGAVTPVNNANKKVHPLVIENAADANVLVDEDLYLHKNHKAADTFETTPLSANASLYLYLDEGHHTVQLGETTQCYHWANGQFSPCTVSDTLAHNDYYHWNACTEPTCTGMHNLQRHVQDIKKTDDTQFWRECVCGYINQPKKDKPLFLITGADRVCQGQDYVFTITLGEELVFDDTMKNCTFTVSDRIY